MNARHGLILGVCLIAIALPEAASGYTFRVGSDGACTHSTIQGAIQTAHDNGTGEDNIYLANNQLYTNQRLVIVNQSVRIVGGLSACDGAWTNSRTLIDGDGSHSVLEIVGDTGVRESVTLVSLELIGGGPDVDHGGGLQVNGLNQVILENVWIHHNQSDLGAGIYFDGSLGGRLFVMQGSLIGGSNVASADGGGIYCREAPETAYTMLAVDDSSISANRANRGGGIFLHNCGLSIIARKADKGVFDNRATLVGGGIYAEGDSSVLIEGSSVFEPGLRAHVTGNSADDSGGGIAIGGGSISLRHVALTQNSANNVGGGLLALGADVRVQRRQNDQCNGYCNLLDDNTAAIGGALAINGNLELSQARLSGNSAPEGSVVYLINGDAELDSFAVFDNGTPGEVFSFQQATITVTSATVADNPGVQTQFRIHDSALSLTGLLASEASGTVVSHTGTGGVQGTCVLAHEDASLAGVTRILVGTPLFADAVGGDYHHAWGSPAIDFCDDQVGATLDIDGQARGFDDPDHTDLWGAYDLGADEYFDRVFADGFEDAP